MSRQDCPLITNHGLILLQIFENSTQTIREIAIALGLTERTIIQNMKDLERLGYIKKQTVGRRNSYSKGSLPLDLYRHLSSIVRILDNLTGTLSDNESKEIVY